MRSPAMTNVCRDYAGKALERLGDGYEADTYVGPNRVNVMVSAKSYQAEKRKLREQYDIEGGERMIEIIGSGASAGIAGCSRISGDPR